MEENRLEEIEFRQDFIEKDHSSPLYMIREKEMEISGRVLACKKEAEEIVSAARRKAAEVVNAAETTGDELAKKREVEVTAEMEREIEDMRAQAKGELEAMKDQITNARGGAVDAVVKMVTDV